ncbi:MAG: ZIP family metal transporter [Acutalibacteraceae bacterium]|jgi:ZIP family zinc transporter
MSLVAWVVVMTAVAGVGGTGLGGVVGAVLKKNSDKMVSLLLSFAGGVMLSIVCFDLIESALHPAGGGNVSIFVIIPGILAGYGVVFLLNYWIDRATNHEVGHIDSSHPKTADDLNELIHSDHFEEHRRKNSVHDLLIGGIVMACAIALHNLPEGMVIGASFVSGGDGTDAFTGMGLVMAIVIGLHNVPEGMAVSVPLVAGGMSRGRAVLTTALTGAPTIIGALIGYFLGMTGPLILALSLSFASGAMLYVVFGELLPESILMWKSKAPAFAAVTGIITGLLIANW